MNMESACDFVCIVIKLYQYSILRVLEYKIYLLLLKNVNEITIGYT